MTGTSPHPLRPPRRRQGFTLLELLVVIAVLGIAAGIGTINARAVLDTQRERSSLDTFQQSIWQGATSASARGVPVELRLQGDELVLIALERGGERRLRAFELHPDVSLGLEDGMVLEFAPPGRVTLESYRALPDPFVLKTSEHEFRLEVSTIGEIRVEAQR